MNRGRTKQFSGIGSRTGKNVLLNKNIRKLPDGRDNFQDYFTDSSSSSSANYSPSVQSHGVSTRSPKALDNENIQGVTNQSPIKSKFSHIVIGSRSKKNILPPKTIRKLRSGRDNYEDYFTDDSSYKTTCNSEIPVNSSPLHSSQNFSENKNSSKIASAAHSSPITRLSSRKAICNDADNPSGSKSEEISPSIGNISSKKIRKSKESAGKSIPEKHDSCDAKLLKLAENYEKSENLSDYDSQLHATKKAKSNISKIPRTSQRIASKSPGKKTVSNASLEKHNLTGSRTHNRTSIKSHSESTDNLLIKTTDNISLNKHYNEQNISKASYSNAFKSEFERSKSQQPHFDINTAQNSDESYEGNPVPEQDGALFGNKRSASKLPVKRKSNLTPNTASKKKSNSVASSMHSKNMQASKDLLDNDLNVTFQVVDPQCLSNSEENSNNHDSQLHEREKADLNPSETHEKFQKTGSKSPKKTVFVSPEEQHYLTTSYIEASIEAQSRNDDMLVRKTHKNIPEKKQVSTLNTSDSNELSKNKSADSHFGVNTAQDSGESFKENGLAEQEIASYENKNITRKSNLMPVIAKKKKSNSSKLVASVKKHMSADKRDENMSLSLNLSDENLNETNKNVQHVDGSPHSVTNATFQINNLELSLSNNKGTLSETNKNKAPPQDKEAHKNKKNSGKNKQTGEKKKANKSFENPKPKTKGKRSSAAQENEEPLLCRRSNRKRMAPLENWRNERALYRIEDNSLHFMKIDPGNKEDDTSKKAIASKLYFRKKKGEESKKKPVKPSKISFKDIILKKVVRIPLLKKFQLIPWDGEPNENAPYCIKKTVETNNTCFGFIEVRAGKSKQSQYLPNEDLYLCLIQGKIKVIVGGKEIALEEKDTLVVPRSVPYALINDAQRKALIIFSVGRFRYLEQVINSVDK